MLLFVFPKANAQTQDTTIYQDYVWAASYLTEASEELGDVARMKIESIFVGLGTVGMGFILFKAVATENTALVLASGVLVTVGTVILIHHLVVRLIKNKKAAQFLALAAKELVRPKPKN